MGFPAWKAMDFPSPDFAGEAVANGRAYPGPPSCLALRTDSKSPAA
jgi:hypothetical protein